MREKLITYMKYGQMIEIMYVSSDETISKRRITVHEVEVDRLRAYCHLRHGYRTFYVERILALFPVINHIKGVEYYAYK